MNSCINGAPLKWRAGEWLREILLADEDILEMVGEHIYPLNAPEGTDGDFITYSRLEYVREYGQMGLYRDEAVIQVVIISDDYDRSLDIVELVDAVLSGTHNADDGTTVTFKLQDSKELFEDLKFFQIIEFRVL